MFAINRHSHPLHRRYYYYGLAGFLCLSLGYLLRGQLTSAGPLLGLLLGIFPNLLGSFATPFILVILMAVRYPSLKALNASGLFVLVNLFTLCGALFIEYLHVAFNAGVWDANDIYASIAGGLAAMILYTLTCKMMKCSDNEQAAR